MRSLVLRCCTTVLASIDGNGPGRGQSQGGRPHPVHETWTCRSTISHLGPGGHEVVHNVSRDQTPLARGTGPGNEGPGMNRRVRTISWTSFDGVTTEITLYASLAGLLARTLSLSPTTCLRVPACLWPNRSQDYLNGVLQDEPQVSPMSPPKLMLLSLLAMASNVR